MRKTKLKKPATSYTPAPAVAAMAEELIAEFHPHLHEYEVRIEYIFRSDTPKTKGKMVRGVARKVSSLNAFFGREDRVKTDATAKPFFAIVISKPAWDGIDDAERRALVDHELCHLGAGLDGDGNLKLELLHHDLEEFRAVVERHGLWKLDVKRFAKSVMTACPQQMLELEDNGERGVTTITFGSLEEANETLKQVAHARGAK